VKGSFGNDWSCAVVLYILVIRAKKTLPVLLPSVYL